MTFPALVHLRGASRAIFDQALSEDPPDEVLIVGPAGTGKTRGLVEFDNWKAETFPGCRLLWARKHRQTLRQSVQVTFEQKCGFPEDHPAIAGRTREGRTCGAKCRNSAGPSCTCSCGGHAHGKDRW